MCNAIFLVITLTLIIVTHSAESYSFTRIKRDSKECPSSSFACSSGECIEEDKECDGAVDCKDASDETNACLRIKCPPFLFRCDYGACISAVQECDGKPDCRDGSDEKTAKCRTVDESGPQCKNNEFRCISGQCIDEDNKCDGIAQCSDRSDEIKETCWNLRCPSYTYRCNYGACVNGNAQCNGQVECQDASDEDPSICKNVSTSPARPPVSVTPSIPAIPGSCVLPPYPESGKWAVFGDTSNRYRPGMSVGIGTILSISCQPNHRINGAETIYCQEGKWNKEISWCEKLCKPLSSTSTVTITCVYPDKGETENCTNAIDGTLAKFKCAPFYEDPYLQRLPAQVCKDGTWSQRKPECSPVCGQKTVDAQKLIVNGQTVKKGNYPWQAALYTKQNKELICGGSLINLNIIVTAAHCLTDQNDKPLPKENYLVAVGKYYRKFDDPRDAHEAQFSEIKKIFLNDKYQGAVQNFVGDIALLVTVKVFIPSLRIQPVCMDWGSQFDLFTAKNEYGYVTGWGYTVENANPSEELKELKIPLISTSKCMNNLPEDFHRYNTYDKFCAGYINQSTTVCKGDSGGGLVVKYEGRYYLTGVVSLSPTAPSGGCDSQQYGLFTKVSAHTEDFILKKVTRYKENYLR